MSWTHIRDTDRTARKRHQCFLCSGEISPGDNYVERFGCRGRFVVTMRMHQECEAVTRDWHPMDWETFLQGDFQRQIVGTKSQSRATCAIDWSRSNSSRFSCL